MKCLFLFILIGCAYNINPYPEPKSDERLNVTDSVKFLDSAYKALVTCAASRTPLVPLSKIKFYITNENYLFNPSDKLGTVVSGQAWILSQNAYIVKESITHRNVWTHEMAHIVYQVNDHPSDIFDKCGLNNSGLIDWSLYYLTNYKMKH